MYVQGKSQKRPEKNWFTPQIYPLHRENPEGQGSGLATSRDLSAFDEHEPVDAIFVFPLSLDHTYLTERSLYIHL